MLAPTNLQRIICAGLFVIAAVLARGTKELVIALPFLMLLVEWFFLAQEDWSAFKKRFFIGLGIASVLLFTLLWQHSWSFIWDAITLQASTVNNRGNILTPNPYDIISPWMFFISEFRVLVHYIAIFFWPFDISVEYDWKIASGFFTPQVLIPGLVLLAIMAFVIHSIVRKKNVLTVFGLLWFFITIAPRATIIPSAELVCDYKTYLASYGILLMISGWLVTGLYALRNTLKQKDLWVFNLEGQMIVASVLMVTLGIGSYERNKVWSNPVDFWQDNAKKAPLKARVHNNLGVALSESGRYKESLNCYFTALSLDKYYADPYSNLAVAYSMLNETDKAIDALRNAIHIYPEYPEAYNNLGSLLMQKGKLADAEQALLAAVELRGHYGKAHYNLARLYEEKGEMDKSWHSLKAAVDGDMDVPEVYFKFGQMSLKIQKYAEAAAAFEWVINHGEGQDLVWFNLANSLYMLGQQDKARGIYERLAKNNPLDGRYAFNLAEAYFAKNEFEKALFYFQKVTSLPQPIAQSFFRVAHCLEKMNKADEATAFLYQLKEAEATDDFKKALQGEIGRIELAQQIKKGNGTVTLTQLKNTLTGKTSTATAKG
jgi:tetratricopeptide (TPR) repeat protein